MSRGLRVGGHPLHAALSDFPLVLFLLWVVMDAVALGGGAPLFWTLGHWVLIAGVVAAGLAATAGFIDYLGVSKDRPEALRTATTHLLVMLSVTCIAVVVLIYRGAEPPTGTGRVLLMIALVLVALGLAAGGWLGGHLVFHFGVGVDRPGDERKP